MDKVLKLSANQRAIKSMAIFFAIVVIVGVVGYSEVMFLAVLSRAFPDGIFKVIAMIGGVATGLSVLTLLLAKAYWFRPGIQGLTAWAFTGVEVVILTLNVLLSFALSSGPLHPSDPLYTWYTFCPSSPIFALVGWTVLIMQDQSQRERHDHMEMEDEKREAELQHERLVHRQSMKLRAKMVAAQSSYMDQYMESPDVQEVLKQGTQIMATQVLSEMIGQHIAAMRNQSPQGLPAIGHGKTALPMGNLSDIYAADLDNQEPGGEVPRSGDRPGGIGPFNVS